MFKLHIQGIIASLASATPADVFTGSSGLYPFPASALATTIVSGSASDTAAGTGARTCKVSGLDANFMEIAEIVNLSGATPVNLVNSYLRINKVEVLTAGSDGTNDGIISVKQSSTVVAAIAVSAGRSQMAVYTASASRAATALKKLFVACTNQVAGGGTFTLFTRKSGGIWQIRHVHAVYGTNCPADAFDFASPIVLDPGEDVRISATVNANSTAVAAGFDIWEGSSTEFSNPGYV
jgi:hypothetical protein